MSKIDYKKTQEEKEKANELGLTLAEYREQQNPTETETDTAPAPDKKKAQSQPKPKTGSKTIREQIEDALGDFTVGDVVILTQSSFNDRLLGHQAEIIGFNLFTNRVILQFDESTSENVQVEEKLENIQK